ncbi:MAG: response regulator transcription factor [Firmicutes bacterium]|nr:response regulator transcription factor [Bacillota bacterium]
MPAARRQARKVIIVEDQHLYRDLLRKALFEEEYVHIVGAFGDGESALAQAPMLSPDVAVIDIYLGSGMNGIALATRIRSLLPRIGIVLLSNHACLSGLEAIVSGSPAPVSYLLKDAVTNRDALLNAIIATADGFVVLDAKLLRLGRAQEDERIGSLTPRQREILDLVAKGYTNAAIAGRLLLTEKSVENQLHLIYQRLGLDRGDSSVHRRVQVVLKYVGVQPGATASGECAPLRYRGYPRKPGG